MPFEIPDEERPTLHDLQEPLPPQAGDQRLPASWSFRDLFLFLGFAAAAYLLTSMLGFYVYSVLGHAMGWQGSVRAIAHNTFFLLAVQMGFYVLLFAYIYFLVKYQHRMAFWDGIRWGRLTRTRVVRYAMAGVLMMLAVQIGSALLPDNATFPLEKMFSSPGASYALAIFATLVGPFMEELIFRGVLFSVFEARTGLASAVIVTSILFSAMHIPEYRGAWDHLAFIFLVGLILALARAFTHSLAPGVVMHITYNGCLMLLLFFASSHFHVIEGLTR